MTTPPEINSQLWEGWGGHVAWEIGAGAGESVPALVQLFDRVECFEPAVEAFTVLALNFVDSSGVNLHRYALGDHDGILETSIRQIPMQFGQLVAVGMPYEDFVPGVSSPQKDGLPWGKEIATREVLCRSVDSLTSSLGVPDFCRVDTEGGEADILRGAADTLAWGRVSWLIEFHTAELYEDCIKLLHNAGYQPEIVRHPHYAEGSSLWHNHGWIRAKSTE